MDIILRLDVGFPGIGSSLDLMERLWYKDFPIKRLAIRGTRRNAVPESKQAFLRKVDKFLSENKRVLINVESREGFFRVWYREPEG